MVEKLAREIISESVKSKVYDIYLLPFQSKYQIYFRGAQNRFLYKEIDQEQAQSLLAHFKFVSGMNVGEKRRTQLGSCWYEVDGVARRLRLSTVGDFLGKESLVIRLLHDEKIKLEFWFDDDKELEKIISGRGLYLFSGPVGSGKTTLMYELAKQHFAQQQVISIEDPVEIVNKEFLQLQLNSVIGNDYDELIKLSLRHRPDLVIVGEIRDKQTAQAVIRASLTGYTVFSTVHAKSISGVQARLLELGLSKEEIRNSVQGILYQRLIAGKGMIDWVKGDVDDYRQENWNERIEKLASDGHITSAQAKAEKIKTD
ncbi:MAG: Flp pilus assembly complex ATPase component TadA [Streptococcaceae bacterium]|nr:Flp pilus assembly complex ATPase component TadA [Streptococcaceae bacterium]